MEIINPRLKYENHIKELFNRIKEILNIESNIIITKPRNSRPNANVTVTVTVTVTVVLDINYIASLKFKVLPLFSSN